ncbi:MAG: serine hydrolase domain-containing protein [Bryobacteraceae bacterium]
MLRSAFFVAISVCLAAPVAVVKDQAKTGLDPARLAQIPVRMKAFVDKGTVAGTVTLVARRGQVAALDAAGYTDIETRQPMKTDNIFQLHSMTKPIVCIAVMQLAEDGKLALVDPVEKYLPEFRGQMMIDRRNEDGSIVLKKPSRAITLRDLMTHTAGMPLNPPPGIGELHGALHRSLADVVAIESQQPLLFEPGSKWSYSNTGIASLARVIEVVSGVAYEKYLEDRIFKPLGMHDTHTYPPAEKHHRMPTAYILKDGKPVKYTADPLGEGAMKFRVGAKYPLPEGGLYSTASDLFLLYQAMLNGGSLNGTRILSKASVDVMTRVHTGNLAAGGPGMGYGLGWAVVRDNTGTLTMLSPGTYGHGGRYGTYCFIDPKREMIGIFMIHREGGSDERNAFVEMAVSAAVD